MTQGKKPFENIVGKEENAGNQHFLLFPQCFLQYQRQKAILNLKYALCLSFDILIFFVWQGVKFSF